MIDYYINTDIFQTQEEWLKSYMPPMKRTIINTDKSEKSTIKSEKSTIKSEKSTININLNLFLKLLGATDDIICDDHKTLEFMFEIKKKLEDAYGEIKSTVEIEHEK